MHRRVFLGSLTLGVFARPWTVGAQSAGKPYRVGILTTGSTAAMIGPTPASPSVSALLHGMQALGRVYGRDFLTEPRGAERQLDPLPALAGELVRRPVDVIVAVGLAMPAVKQATSTIPIVMIGSDDPVSRGHVRSLHHPGGNITGLSTQGMETAPKRIELLKELVPGKGPVAVLWDQGSRPIWRTTQAAAQQRGWKLLSLEIHDPSEIDGAFRSAARARAAGMVVSASQFTSPQARHVAELAAQSRIPAIYEFPFFTDAGGLIFYGVSETDMWQRAAAFVDKILRGARPADLPVEQASKFDLVINRKASTSLGLTIPPSLLLRADRVIDQ